MSQLPVPGKVVPVIPRYLQHHSFIHSTHRDLCHTLCWALRTQSLTKWAQITPLLELTVLCRKQNQPRTRKKMHPHHGNVPSESNETGRARVRPESFFSGRLPLCKAQAHFYFILVSALFHNFLKKILLSCRKI